MKFEAVLKRIIGAPGGAQDFVLITNSGEVTLSLAHLRDGEEPQATEQFESGQTVSIEVSVASAAPVAAKRDRK